MAILKVARMGHPVLRKIAKPISADQLKSERIQTLIQDMIETMYEYDGLGLAAPQVHESIRLSVVDFGEAEKDRRKKDHEGLFVFINPVLTALTDVTESYWEGCLSVPELRGLVARPNRVKVQYLDQKGTSREIVCEGFQATIVQHEFDHLDGKLYIDRLVDPTKLSFEKEFEKYGADGKSSRQMD